MSDKVMFPISVKFEDGTIETYDNLAALETDLEVFDSGLATDCEVRDFLGRPVRLRIAANLMLEELSLVK